MATVLVTDDAMFIRMQLKTIIEGLGYEVIGEATKQQMGMMQLKKQKIKP